MDFIRPEGCRAAVSSDWKYERGNYKLTARMVCGERNNVVEGSFGREFLDIGTGYKSEQTEERVSKDTSDALGAMCLGCPHNTVTNEAVVEITPVQTD